jgi:hypothetical protein
LPISQALKNELRVQEKKSGLSGAIVFIVVLFSAEMINLPRELFTPIVPLMFAGYVLSSLEGNFQTVFLLAMVCGSIFIALLIGVMPNAVLYLIVGFEILISTVGAAWIARLQFVRARRPDLKNWLRWDTSAA